MIVREILKPKSIAVIGGSRTITKPGGKIVKNLLEGSYSGDLYVVNRNDTDVQGVPTVSKIEELPDIELGIIAISAEYALAAVKELADTKNTKGFIIISAGFGELSEEGKEATLAILEPGEIFGELEALQGVARESMVQALEPVLVCEIRREDFDRYLYLHPEVGGKVIKWFGRRLRQIETRVSDKEKGPQWLQMRFE